MTRMEMWLSADAAALALGAGAVAEALQVEARARGVELRLRRPGSRGMHWLEPLLEVETPRGRVAYGPVSAGEVPGLLEALLRAGGEHPLRLGAVEQLPWWPVQRRVCFERGGLIEPLDFEGYRAAGGGDGLRRALAMPAAAIVGEVEASGLRGRGGAAFPAGRKWRTVLEAPADCKYIVCNADEGDSGTFADRMLMEGDPFALLEGMAIAGLAVGAEAGFIYVRAEYPHAWRTLCRAVERARGAGLLGPDLLGSGRRFDVQLRLGAGAYICGEETSLLESLEGRRGLARARPPLPALSGLWGRPTVVNNVLTLAAVPWIIRHGAEAHAALGCGRSRGSIALQLAGNIARGGLLELPFGISLREVVEVHGGGTASGRPLRAVQVGGPLGAYLRADQLDIPVDYEAFAAAGAMLGHGGIVAFDDSVDLGQMARFAMEFCAAESCGKCTPCRIGSTRAVEVIDRLLAGDAGQRELLLELCDTMEQASLCGLGGLAPSPVRSLLQQFPEDFGLEGAP